MNDLMKWIAAIFAVVVGISAFGLAAWFLLDPDGFSDQFADVDLIAVNTAVGVFLIATGLALAVVGYVSSIVLNIAPKKEEGMAELGINLEDAIKALTDLLKQAGGLGIAVMLLGVILLTGTALGDVSDSASTTNGVDSASASR